MKTQPYDLIGDIHGHYDKLIALLNGLDYEPHNGSYRHPDGRKVIFLGDYIDRGPKIRETLRLVRAMVDAGEAQAIMGNHEFNAIAYDTPDGNGGFLRPRIAKNITQQQGRIDQFAGHPKEWTEWLAWMKRLPVSLDLGALRAVHACWDTESLGILSGRNLTDESFLLQCTKVDTPEFKALENTLKGPELDILTGFSYESHDGQKRRRIRARWWNLAEGVEVGEIALPMPMAVNRQLTPRELQTLPNYAVDAPPVFVGHYSIPPNTMKAPLSSNIACLDYSAAFDDFSPIVAYRWDGEPTLTAANFVHTQVQ